MLQFMDCSNCGKRVRTTAVKCHHCQQALVSAVGQNPSSPSQRGKREPASESDSSEAHHGLNGGYAAEDDDFDYEEFLAEEFPDQAQSRRSTVKPWVWITAWLLIAAMLLPFLLYFINQ